MLLTLWWEVFIAGVSIVEVIPMRSDRREVHGRYMLGFSSCGLDNQFRLGGMSPLDGL